MASTLSDWVAYIQTLHVREIDLTLERVAEVYRRLIPNGLSCKIISVAGTNGKGSTAELLASIYRAAGYTVGKYTSPHLCRFNERFQINRQEVKDEVLIAAFERVEQARQTTRLTFFEFGTLLGIELFAKAETDIAIMEVGLGGRLDAVNILDADLAVVTSLSIDHTAWLGSSIEAIGREKIAIARSNKPCVLGLSDPPKSVRHYCDLHYIDALYYGVDFQAVEDLEASNWQWQSGTLTIPDLPLPFAQRGHQLSNAAIAVQAVTSLQDQLPVSHPKVAQGIAAARLPARCELVSRHPHIVIDVAHNVDSVAALRDYVHRLDIVGRTYAVCGMLADKQIAEALSQLEPIVDEWYFANIANSRAASAADIDNLLRKHLFESTGSAATADLSRPLICHHFQNVKTAYGAAKDKLQSNDCLIVFGSFFAVGDIIN